MYWAFIKYCFFYSNNFRYFATSPSPGLGCYWLYRKWTANQTVRVHSDLRSQMSCSPHAGDELQ